MVVPQLRAQLLAYPGYKVAITDHSLGAAMAVLTFPKLKDSTEFGSLNLPLFQYGSPRVGNLTFATWMNAQINANLRVVSKVDLISHIFLALQGYVDSGNEYWRNAADVDRLCDQNVFEDATCSNSLGPPLYNTNDNLIYLGVPKDGCNP